MAVHTKTYSLVRWVLGVINLTKSTLKKILGRMCATLESLQTIFIQVEALLNDRPLTYASLDISDPEPIAPSYLRTSGEKNYHTATFQS